MIYIKVELAYTMGNTFPKKFKYDPHQYAEFKTETRGGSLRAFLFWRIEIELKDKSKDEFEKVVVYMSDIIVRLQENQEDYHSVLFEIFQHPVSGVICCRVIKFPG